MNTLPIIGNNTYSDWRLKDVIKERRGGAEWTKVASTLLIRTGSKPAAQLPRRFLLEERSDADVRIVSALTEYDIPAPRDLTSRSRIQEGSRYKVGPICRHRIQYSRCECCCAAPQTEVWLRRHFLTKTPLKSPSKTSRSRSPGAGYPFALFARRAAIAIFNRTRSVSCFILFWPARLRLKGSTSR